MTNRFVPGLCIQFLTILLLVAAFVPGVSQAQDATARITGTVSDASGAVIPGVQIKVTNVATQVTREATSDHDGFYQVLALPIGSYRVTAGRQGFRTVVSSEYKLLINQALRVDFRMEVGTASEQVEVGAEAAPVETVNATLGQSVTGRTLTNMPLNGRDALDLALLQPGVTDGAANINSPNFGQITTTGTFRGPTPA